MSAVNPQSLASLIADMREAAKPGIGAAADWSDEECARYWASVAAQCRKVLREAAAALEAVQVCQDGGWNEAIEAAARVADERVQAYAHWPAPHLLNAARHGEAERIRDAIRALPAPPGQQPTSPDVSLDGPLVEALRKIAEGTQDRSPPFRSLPSSEMSRIAREALASADAPNSPSDHHGEGNG